MKLAFAVLLASVLALHGSALPALEVEARAEQCTGLTTVPLLRGYRGGSAADHFYTTSALEMENAVGGLGYASEGDAALVSPTQAPDTIPLYRMYSPSASDHFYTTNAAERNNAITSLGYVDEGVTAYVYSSSLCATVPLFRMYSPSQTDHFYTTDAAERNRAITNLGYVDEGIAAYVHPV
ncbi:hypothetical protein C8Q74DRAFT_1022206 [Fomes fomentarius]|nr:hypothetical protein C8Q74DRAFT_1022206 [Fomes fomentarius]